jgi:hypothetical protein
MVIKRINLAVRPGAQMNGGNYVPDRQSIDGSFVYTLPAGHHDVALVVQQIQGGTKNLQAFYTNIQALSFPKK